MWNDADRERMLARIASVEAAAQPRWGRMSADQMLAHLVQSLKMAVGELATRSKKLPLRYFPLKQLVVYLAPFPKGAPTAKELLAGDASSTERSKAELQRLFDAFARRRGERVWPEHPAFGKLTERAWGVLSYRHFDHHLRQFGL
ncbi:MAG TPA: DUF1569 domain-containing protein [Thermoanaerobaculia bacterium]|jgi:hypothetical protein|nr:DUF1569 domain-containing protein [Thermoanaerobaculia bacterium]